jgi:pre-rRNA-processing protein IPI3
MLSQKFISTISGPHLAPNTAVSKDVGLYSHSLTPSHTIKSTFKKSSTPVNGLAVSETHIFTAQDQKAHVHVYAIPPDNSNSAVSPCALVPFPERIRCLAVVGQVLVLGSTEGRLFLWEVSSSRPLHYSTVPCCVHHEIIVYQY